MDAFAVIPGRGHRPANPEPMHTGGSEDGSIGRAISLEVRVLGFRACPSGASRNDELACKEATR
jgi:hypothetical protein